MKVRDGYEMGGKVLKYRQSKSKVARLLLETGEGAGLVSERWWSCGLVSESWLRYCADIIRGLAKVWDWSETDGQGIELVAEIKYNCCRNWWHHWTGIRQLVKVRTGVWVLAKVLCWYQRVGEGTGLVPGMKRVLKYWNGSSARVKLLDYYQRAGEGAGLVSEALWQRDCEGAALVSEGWWRFWTTSDVW